MFAVVDAKLRHACRQESTGLSANGILRQSIFEVTGAVATPEDLRAVATLFDPTRFLG